MRVILNIDNDLQMYELYGVVVCENHRLLLRVKECGWDIVVFDVPNNVDCMKKLMVYDYLDLSGYRSEFLKQNEPNYETSDIDGFDREIESNFEDEELDFELDF